MSIVILKNKPTAEQFEQAKTAYKTYIKITIDVAKEIIALGGEYHADAEQLLLQKGSCQKDIWGGGINLETKQFETNAIINLRVKENPSTEILDSKTREAFLALAKKALAKKALQNYV